MNLHECIWTRGTCKEYLQKEVPLELLADMLETAHFAPSAGNMQNWEFVVVRDEKKRKALAAAAKQDWVADAPACIVVCNNKADVVKEFPDRGELYATQNCAITASFILLRAHELGLGSAFVGAFDEAQVKKVVDLPVEISPDAIVTVGYAASTFEVGDRKSVRHMTFFEAYGKKVLKRQWWPLSKHAKKAQEKTAAVPKEAMYKASAIVDKTKAFIKKFKREEK